MDKSIQFDNIDFSNPAAVPVMVLLLVACQDEEWTKQCKQYLEEYKENIKKGEDGNV